MHITYIFLKIHIFILDADEMLKSLEIERNFCEMKQILPLIHDVFEEEERKDIMEHWNEDKLDEWRGIYHYIFYSFK